ncbi:MAG: class I SAM-dependent methyltransferase [Planctomycetota bacterium]|nr:MAG: class I SAM-dependent methyltransferase [Planctomycetota bacterium]
MSFYRDHVLPRGVDWMMRGEVFSAERRKWAEGLHGRVLEVGFGSGLNVPFYPPEVTEILALEPAALAWKLARERVAAAPMPVTFVGLRGEEIPLDAASVDCVGCTWTLCTIPDVAQALLEIRRVLAPGGRFHFLEHGRSEEPRVARWQDRLNPVQKLIGGGCHLNRRIDELVLEAGFRLDSLERYSIKGPKIATALYRGVATAAPGVAP